MSDVVVRFTGDNSDLKRKLSENEKQLSRFGSKAKSAAGNVGGLGNSTGKATGQLRRLAGVMAGGLGIAAAIQGMRAFETLAVRSMQRARREAALTQAAFESALSSTVNVNIPTDTFTITSREQAVQLAQDAAEKLRFVREQLDKSALRFERALPFDKLEGVADKTLSVFKLVGSEAARQEKERLDSLRQQENELQSQVDAYSSIAEKLTQAARLAKQLRAQGLTADPTQPTRGQISDFLRSTPPPTSFSGPQFTPFTEARTTSELGRQAFSRIGPPPELPSGLREVNDEYDKLSLQLLGVQRAAEAGLIPAFDAMNAEASILQSQLMFMIESGVSPANEDFQVMLSRLIDLDSQIAAFGSGAQAAAAALSFVGNVGSTVLGEIAFKFERANDEAAKFRNTLRRIGQQLIGIGFQTLVNVGVGAITGNPLTFGQALGSAVGIGSASSSGVGATAAPTATNFSGGARPAPIKVEVVSQRISGGDFILGLQEALLDQGNGGLSLTP